MLTPHQPALPIELLAPGIAGMRWPALPKPPDALVLALHLQLRDSEFWPAAKMAAMQFRQLAALLDHCARTVPYYRDSLASFTGADPAELTPSVWHSLPILRREQIQTAGDALHSRAVPADHGPPRAISTSGSTGAPLQTLETVVTRVWFSAMHLRGYVWHGLDLHAKVCAIRNCGPGLGMPPQGTAEPAWLTAFRAGPGRLLNIRASMAEQVAWLERERPGYLLTYPSNLMALADFVRDHGADLSFLKAVLTLSETLRPDTRAVCRAAFGCRVVDAYSAVELGLLAWQSPDSEEYLVAAETHLVEVLREDGTPCAPGEVGRVVVTALHNFAMPLIRYANGDFAEVGQPDAAGRGLPVLKRIVGRETQMMMLPDGSRTWPSIRPKDIAAHLPITRAQIVQTALDRLEVRAVLRGAIAAGAEDRCRIAVQADLPMHFQIEFRYLDEIPLGPGGKFEDFVCLI